MTKNIRRAGCVLLAALVLSALTACKKKEDKAFEPTFQLKDYSTDDPVPISFKIPNAWGQVADPSGAGMLVFAGREAYENGGFDNVSVCVYEMDSAAPAMEDVEAAFKSDFEAKVKENYAEAAGFTYGSFETSLRQVFTAEYKVPVLGRELTQKIYYPLVDNLQIYIAACDNGGGEILADDAAMEIVQSLRVGKEVAEEE